MIVMLLSFSHHACQDFELFFGWFGIGLIEVMLLALWKDHLVQLTAVTSGGRLPSFSPQNICECPSMVKGKVFDDNAAWFKCCHTCHSHRSSKTKSKSWNNNGLQGQGFGFDWASHC